jgi:hypothetical protein
LDGVVFQDAHHYYIDNPKFHFNTFGSCFFKCSSLSSVAIPNSVGCIDGACFKGCFSLQNISISHLTKIGDEIFFGCPFLNQ